MTVFLIFTELFKDSGSQNSKVGLGGHEESGDFDFRKISKVADPSRYIGTK